MATPKELHICMGLNACKGHGRSGTNDCAGTGDCATVEHQCHTFNDCRGQGACGGGGSIGSQQTLPGENLCSGKGSCGVVPYKGQGPAMVYKGRTMRAEKEPSSRDKSDIAGPYQGRHVWQVARMLFEQRMMTSGRSYTENIAESNALAETAANTGGSDQHPEFNKLFFGPSPSPLGPGPGPDPLPDQPLYSTTT